MFRGVAKGQIAKWEDAFGPLRTDQQREIQPRQHMAAVWTEVRKLNSAGCKDWEKLYEDAAKKFGISFGKAKEYYGEMQRFMKEYEQDVCMELKEKYDHD